RRTDAVDLYPYSRRTQTASPSAGPLACRRISKTFGTCKLLEMTCNSTLQLSLTIPVLRVSWNLPSFLVKPFLAKCVLYGNGCYSRLDVPRTVSSTKSVFRIVLRTSIGKF